MRNFWRHYLHELRTLWRMLVFVLAALFCALLVLGGGDANATPLVLAVATLLLGVPIYLIAALPLPFVRPVLVGAISALPFLALVNFAVPRLGLSDAAGGLAHPILIFVLIFAALMIRIPVTLRGRRIVRPANALVFGADDLRSEIFARLRPAAGQAFPDPLFLPNERLDEAGEVYRAPVREDAGKTMGGQRVTVVEAHPPERLHLRVEMRIRGRPQVIDQDWRLVDRPDGAVVVTVRQRMRLGPLNWLMMMAVDTVGDWLEAVLTWITGEDMRAAYGRMVNRRIARAAARGDDRQARGEPVSGNR